MFVYVHVCKATLMCFRNMLMLFCYWCVSHIKHFESLGMKTWILFPVELSDVQHGDIIKTISTIKWSIFNTEHRWHVFHYDTLAAPAEKDGVSWFRLQNLRSTQENLVGERLLQQTWLLRLFFFIFSATLRNLHVNVMNVGQTQTWRSSYQPVDGNCCSSFSNK